MTKADVIRQVAESTGLSKEEATSVVEAFMKTIKNALSGGENVYLRGFGTFEVKKRAEKTARNITKNTTMIIPAHYVPRFKPADEFVESVKTKVKDKE